MLKSHRPNLDINAPFVAVSSGTTHIFKTGNQRTEFPVFTNKIAPCRHACPIGIDIPQAFYRASKGDIDGALKVYLQENPLPGVCGRVCYHPCENECNRGRFDEAISVRSLERYLSDYGHANMGQGARKSRKEKIAIIGSGPCGLSAAYHLARLGYFVNLFEGRQELGGMLRYGIPPYRLPRDVLDREINRILSLGIEVRTGTVVGRDLSWGHMNNFDAVFLSVGLQRGKTLFDANIANEDILTGIEFLADPERWAFDDDTTKILIVGGGNVAIDVARTLLRLRNGNVDNINIVCPESRNQMPSLSEEIEEAEEEGLVILNGWAPLEIHGEEPSVKSIDFYRAAVEVNDETGEVKILRMGEGIKTLAVDKIIVAIGQKLYDRNLPEGLEMIQNAIAIDMEQKTSLPKVFAGGDAAGERAFVADAIASGKKGALAIHCYLQGMDFFEECEPHQIGLNKTICFEHFVEGDKGDQVDLKRIVAFEGVNTLFFEKASRIAPKKMESKTRKATFDEVIKGLTREQLENEISRCFKCGTCIDCENCMDFCPDMSIIREVKEGNYHFDSDFCKGCGICSVACPRGIIEMTGEAI